MGSSPNRSTFPARWFSSEAPIGSDVEVHVSPAGLTFGSASDTRTWPIEAVRLSRPVRRGERVTVEWTGTQEALVFADPEILDALRGAAPALGTRFPRASRAPFLARAALILVPLVGLTVLTVTLGLPMLATGLARSVPAQWEDAFGEIVIAEFAPEDKVIRDPRVVAGIDRIAKRLADASPSPYRLRVTVVNRPEVNALAAPGGHVVLFRGLIEEARSPEELAGVLAHEIEHVRRRHVTEALFQRASLGMLMSLMIGDASGPAGMGLQMAQALGELSYGRDDEFEADSGGLETLLAARIDPRGMPDFLERMRDGSPATPWAEFLSTHPGSAARAERVRSRIAEQGLIASEPLLPDSAWSALRAALAAPVPVSR